MRSDEIGVLYRLLDPAFGFFVWAVHFLALYVTNAVACQLGRPVFRSVLAAITLVAAGVVVAHAVKRYRQLSALVRKFGHVFVRPPVGDLGRPAAGVVWPSPGG